MLIRPARGECASISPSSTARAGFVTAGPVRGAGSPGDQRPQPGLVQGDDPQGPGPGELGPRVLADHDVVGLLRDTGGDAAGRLLDEAGRLVPGEGRQGAG